MKKTALSYSIVKWIPVTILMYMIFWVTGMSFSQPLAENSDKFLGNALGNTIYNNYTKYWNQVTPGNAGKWESVEYIKDNYNWTQLDNIYNFARENDLIYKHHTLVWGNQQPSWIADLDSAEQREQVEEWIQLVGERYPDMDFVDVVNEPFNAPPPYAQGLGGDGVTGYDWVITAFELAREYCAPDVKLVLNEYNILQSNSVTNNYIALIDTLKARNLIDAIGIQGHYFEFRSSEGSTPSYAYSIETIKSNLDKLAEIGIPIYITEFDINEEDDQTQLEMYQTYFPIFWEHPAVKGMTLWGYVQYDMWKVNAYLLTDRYKERPAMEWLRNYINAPVKPELISPVTVVNVPQNPVLLWHASEKATEYQVQFSTTSVFTVMVLDTIVADTSLQLTNLDSNERYFWRVSAQNDQAGSEFSDAASFITADFTKVDDQDKVPNRFSLLQNYPNPFNPSTNITFELPARSQVTLVLLNVLGEKVMDIAQGTFSAGIHTLTLNAGDLTSGVYFYKIDTGQYHSVKKMILMQ